MKKKRLRVALYVISGVSVCCLIWFAGSELYANHVASVWSQAGFPDLRAPDHNNFWPKVLFSGGIACLSFGAALCIPKENVAKKEKNSHERRIHRKTSLH